MKGFELEQGEAAMKVGTDGTVLGAYTIEWLLKRHIQPRLILDVGTGTGVIASCWLRSFPPQCSCYRDRSWSSRDCKAQFLPLSFLIPASAYRGGLWLS